MRTDETRVEEHGRRGQCAICKKYKKKFTTKYEWEGGSLTVISWRCAKATGNDADGYKHP